MKIDNLKTWPGYRKIPDRLNITDEVLNDQKLEKLGNKTAFVFEDEKLSYQLLKKKVNALSLGLKTASIKPKEKVLIRLQNCPEFIISFSDILLIIAAIFFAIQIIMNDIYIKKNKSPFTFAFSQYFIVFIFTFFLAVTLENPTISNISIEFFEIFYAGSLSVGIAYTLQILGQNKTSPAPAAIILSMEAVFAAIAGWIIINQSMTLIKIFV